MWTRRASALLAGVAVFYLIGLSNTLFTAYFLAGAALAWLIAAWVITLRQGRRLVAARTLSSPRLYVGEPMEVTLRVDTGAAPQTVTLRETVRNLTLGDQQELRWVCETTGEPTVMRDRVVPDHRGHQVFSGLVAEISDPLALFRYRRQSPETCNVIVYPKPIPLPHFPLHGLAALGLSTTRVDRRAGEMGDFYGVRPYQHGDELRHVHWKSTAHSGRLAIKQYQHRATSATVLYLDCQQPVHAAQGEHSTLEQAVQAAADLAGHVLEAGSPLRLVQAGAKIKIVPSDRGERQLMKVLEVLALAQADGEAPLSAVIAGDREARPEGGTVIAVTPGAHDELTRSLLGLRSRGANLVVVMVPAHRYGGAADPEAASRMFGTLASAGATVYLLEPGQKMAAVMRAGGLWH